MYKEHKIILSMTWLITLVISYIIELSYSTNVSGQILTVLAIFFGFYVTSIALLAGSQVYSDLHAKEDKRGDRRLSHTLKDYYKFGLTSLLVGIVIFLIVSIFTAGTEIILSTEFKFSPSLHRFLNAFASAQLAVCMVFSFIHTRLFLVLFGNEAYSRVRKIKK